MQTLKTAVVVVLLLFVLYGGFVAINGSNDSMNPELEAMVVGFDVDSPDISGTTGPVAPSPSSITGNTASGASDPWAAFNPSSSSGFPGSNSSSKGNAFSNANNSGSAAPATLPPIPPSLAAEAGGVASNSDSSSDLPVPALPATLLPPSASSGSSDAIATTPDATNSLPSPLPGIPGLPGPDGQVAGGQASPSSENANSKSDFPSPSDFGIALPAAKPADDSAAKTSPPNGNGSSIDIPKPDPGKAYENAKENALAQAKRGQLREALATLSLFYGEKGLTPEQRQDMHDILDALAREVIYSRQHYLDIAYYPVPNETIDQIAAKFDIPVDILARINGMTAGAPIPTGTSVKVVPGPFRAEVDVNRNELTLFLGELYAGRYPISLGKDKEIVAGDFKVVDKQRDRNYYSDGNPIAGNDPANPYGGYWIDLGNDISIHGSSSQDADERGCISLSPKDVSDIFGMLAHGSQVTIIR